MKDIINKKVRLKKLLSENIIEELFERIEETLNPNSEAFNEFILLKGRFQFLTKQILRNTLYHSEAEVELNKIRASLLNFIDKLTFEDFSDDAEQFILKKENYFDIIVVNERIELLSNENLNVKFDNSPDGLPRIINIDNSNSNGNILNDKFREHSSIFEAIKSIEEQVKIIDEFKDYIFLKSTVKKNKGNNIILGKTIENLIKGSLSLASLRNSILTSQLGKDVVNYTIENQISTYFPKTVLTQILGEESVLDIINASARNERHLQKHRVQRTVANFFDNDNYHLPNTAAVRPNPDDISIFKIYEGKRIALELDTNKVNLVTFKDTEENGNIINSIKPVIEEELAFVKAKYKIFANEFSKTPEKVGYLSDIIAYEKDLYEVIKQKKSNTITVKYSFNKKRVLEGFYSFFEAISEKHNQGFVHGDISPKNIILTKNGFYPIDPLDIEIGKVSTSLTPNYCAPEQVLKQPLTQQTDIYNIGLLLLSFFKGLLFGKLENFLFPINENQLISTLFISSPEVLIYFNDKLTKKQKLEWLKLIENCIKFNPEERIKSVAELNEIFKRLVDSYPSDEEFDNVFLDFGKISFVSAGEKNVRIVRLISTSDNNRGYANMTSEGIRRSINRCPNCGWVNSINASICDKCRSPI